LKKQDGVLTLSFNHLIKVVLSIKRDFKFRRTFAPRTAR